MADDAPQLCNGFQIDSRVQRAGKKFWARTY